MTSFPKLDAPLTGPVVALRPAAERDIPEILIAHERDRDLHELIGQPLPPSGAELGRRAERTDDEWRFGSAAWLTILAPGSDECRGQIDVHDVDWGHRRAAVTIWVAPGDRGRGLATGALGLLAGWLLAEAGLDRVELAAPAANEPLIRAALAAGWRREGVLRGYIVSHGRRIDVEMMSAINGDLEAR
jgi:RimJ/RimL family protein N-acetyltransferase